MAVSLTPWMGTVTLALANTAYALSTLLSALDESLKPQFPSNGPPRAQFVALQGDELNLGAKFFIGGPSLSATHKGVQIFGSQVWPIYSVEANLIRLDHVYLMSDTAGVSVNVSFLTR